MRREGGGLGAIKDIAGGEACAQMTEHMHGNQKTKNKNQNQTFSRHCHLVQRPRPYGGCRSGVRQNDQRQGGRLLPPAQHVSFSLSSCLKHLLLHSAPGQHVLAVSQARSADEEQRPLERGPAESARPAARSCGASVYLKGVWHFSFLRCGCM
jgi:hypothetical protein